MFDRYMLKPMLEFCIEQSCEIRFSFKHNLPGSLICRFTWVETATLNDWNYELCFDMYRLNDMEYSEATTYINQRLQEMVSNVRHERTVRVKA